MEKEKVGPRIAFAPDGKVLFFDENGKPIRPNVMSREDFMATVNQKKLQHYETISLFFVQGSECKIIVYYDNVRYCFKVDCITGKFLGLC